MLACLDIDFTVDADTSFEEDFGAVANPVEIPSRMSEGKSLGFHRPLEQGEILITSDTMVFCAGEALGKPHSREDAERMLRLLSGRPHEVVTAVTIRDTASMETFSDTTTVWFKDLTDREIDYYVDTYRPFDKAGAYGIQEWIGYAGITRIDGSFYTVMGLPVHRVYERLIARCSL